MAFAMFAWGMSWTNMKILSEYLQTKELVFLRYFITAISSFFIVLFAKQSFKIDKKSLFIAFITGALTSLYTALTFIGVRLGTAGVAGAFINTLAPIATFIILVIFFKKKIYKIDAIALVLGFVGTILILGFWQLNYEKVFTKYNLFFIIAAWLWATLTITSSFSKKINPLVFSFYMYAFVAILTFPFADFDLLHLSEKDPIFWINILSMSVVSTSIATSLYFLGVEKLGSIEVSSFMFIVPLSSILFGTIFLKESIGFWTIVGTILSICAVYMINRIGIFRG
jgi:drug/metabolite transporter (DMT)-like permease